MKSKAPKAKLIDIPIYGSKVNLCLSVEAYNYWALKYGGEIDEGDCDGFAELFWSPGENDPTYIVACGYY